MGSGFQPKLLQHEIQHFPKRGYFEQKERCGDLLIETAIRRNAAGLTLLSLRLPEMLSFCLCFGPSPNPARRLQEKRTLDANPVNNTEHYFSSGSQRTQTCI